MMDSEWYIPHGKHTDMVTRPQKCVLMAILHNFRCNFDVKCASKKTCEKMWVSDYISNVKISILSFVLAVVCTFKTF